ncbi:MULTISPECIES: hypothetical protein [Sphingobium]|uniref:hypothetical protein n=1 Tax=Sphingobium TaxID=165695 RepID=UPI000829815A|nr:hypothetical protein [Sphingobium cloacae]|tara:strand:+ start:1984 stop:2271 length:288 start_codon:yes stop_codon:yes gene_type:complete
MIERAKIEAVLGDLVEQLAAIEHERWSHWQLYMHSKGQKRPDGSLVFSAEAVSRWEKQATTAYADLTESEKKSDREQVDRYLPLILKTLKTDVTE